MEDLQRRSPAKIKPWALQLHGQCLIWAQIKASEILPMSDNGFISSYKSASGKNSA